MAFDVLALLEHWTSVLMTRVQPRLIPPVVMILNTSYCPYFCCYCYHFIMCLIIVITIEKRKESYYVHSLRLIHYLSFPISFALPFNSKLHGISSPPCGRSVEYFLLPVTVQYIVPPLLKKSEQTFDTFLGK